MAGRYGAALYDHDKRCQLLGIQLRPLPRRLPVDQAVWTLGVELLDPVTDDLNRDTAQCGRFAAAGTIIDRCNRQEPPGLRGVPRMPGREAAGLGIKIRSQGQGRNGVAPSSYPCEPVRQ